MQLVAAMGVEPRILDYKYSILILTQPLSEGHERLKSAVVLTLHCYISYDYDKYPSWCKVCHHAVRYSIMVSGILSWCQVFHHVVRYPLMVSGILSWCQVFSHGVRYSIMVSGIPHDVLGQNEILALYTFN